ncbi:MAG: helix-turn-helix domain-containing protein [Lewinellaceae bacterium]|nr:helix-turn-helix domain-containing protein [Lewinellaceae bacterium]
MRYKIKTEEEYRQVMDKIETYLHTATQGGGFHTLEAEARGDLHDLSRMAEAWEDGIPLMPIRQPQTLVEMIELKMYERKLNQKQLAALLGISASRLSEVMQGKRKVNMDLAKLLYQKLGLSAEFILERG